MQQVVVRISDQHKLLLEQLAEKRQLTLSEIIRKALKDYLEGLMEPKQDNTLLELAKIGLGKKGPADLSSAYKKYLYGKK